MYRHAAANTIVGKVACALRLKRSRPFFLFGTGRCGTSLLTRILASHPAIAVYPTEANRMWHPNSYPYDKATIETPPIEQDPQLFTQLSVDAWPRKHGKKIVRTLTGFHATKGFSTRLVVKSAMISFLIPIIRSLFPESRLIHIYRNGPSVVESLTKKNWPEKFARLMSEQEYRVFAAKYWNSCILEIHRVDKALKLSEGNALLELSYEELCSDPDQQLGFLAQYLGVDKNEYCFDTSEIQSKNYKVASYLTNHNCAPLLELMQPAMVLKGYPCLHEGLV